MDHVGPLGTPSGTRKLFQAAIEWLCLAIVTRFTQFLLHFQAHHTIAIAYASIGRARVGKNSTALQSEEISPPPSPSPSGGQTGNHGFKSQVSAAAAATAAAASFV